MYEYAVKEVTKVVDGDTVDVLIDLGFDISVLKRVRLAGIDAPELHSKDAVEKQLGDDARVKLMGLFAGRTVTVKTEIVDSTDKYGRVLGWFFVEGTSINDKLVAEGYAWKYDGGTKVKNFDELKAKRAK